MSKHHPQLSIRTPPTIRLLRLLLAASLVFPALVLVGTSVQDRRNLMSQAAQRAEASAEVLEQHATVAFHAYELIFAQVDQHLRAAPDEDEAARHAYLASIDRGLKEVGSLFVVDAAGQVIAHSRFSPVPATNVADRDYFRILAPEQAAALLARTGVKGPPPEPVPSLDASGLAVGVPNIGRLSGSLKLNIARAITTPSGQFAGAIVISVSQDYFEAFHRKLAFSSDDSMILARDDGALLARSPALTGADLERVSTLALSHGVLTRIMDGGSTFVSPLDGIERTADYRKLPTYPLYVGYGLATTAVLRVWHRHVAFYGAVALATALTLFAVTWLALRAAQEEAQARIDLVGEMSRREAAEAALRQSQKMEAVGQLTGGVAHDFNNLLAAIMGNLELLAKRIPDDARLRRHVEGALEGARRGASLTQRMLAFARRQDLKFETVDVAVLVRGMADLLERSLGPMVTVDMLFPAHLTPARVDANQLEASLLNLALNARDAMPKGGRITVSAREESVGPGNSLELVPGGYLVLVVGDDGEGMDAATLARAAEPFFTTKPVGKGTGLGLAMVHGLAAQSGGTLRLESVPGRGTTVSIWLPVATTGVGRPLVEAAPSAGSGTPPHRILLVDDDRLVREGTRAMLEDIGHHVLTASSGAEALELLRDGASVDLVVTDHIMPGLTGLELATRLEEAHPGLPVLLASGFADVSETETSRVLARAVAGLADRVASPTAAAPTRQRAR
jgi:signal transduction histidine kinase